MGIPNDYSVAAIENILTVNLLDPANLYHFQNCQKHLFLSYRTKEQNCTEEVTSINIVHNDIVDENYAKLIHVRFPFHL